MLVTREARIYVVRIPRCTHAAVECLPCFIINITRRTRRVPPRAVRRHRHLRILGQRPIVLGELRDDIRPREHLGPLGEAETPIDRQLGRRRRRPHTQGGFEELEFVDDYSIMGWCAYSRSHNKSKIFISFCALYINARALSHYMYEIII